MDPSLTWGSKCFKIRRPRPKPPAFPTAAHIDWTPRSSRVSCAGSEDSSSGLAKELFIDFQRLARRIDSNSAAAWCSLWLAGEFRIAEFCRAEPAWGAAEVCVVKGESDSTVGITRPPGRRLTHRRTLYLAGWRRCRARWRLKFADLERVLRRWRPLSVARLALGIPGLARWSAESRWSAQSWRRAAAARLEIQW